MRITKSLEITHDVAIDVNVHDVIAELAAMPVPHGQQGLLQLLAVTIGAIKAVPEKLIRELNPAQVDTITSALKAELERFSVSANELSNDE